MERIKKNYSLVDISNPKKLNIVMKITVAIGGAAVGSFFVKYFLFSLMGWGVTKGIAFFWVPICIGIFCEISNRESSPTLSNRPIAQNIISALVCATIGSLLGQFLMTLIFVYTPPFGDITKWVIDVFWNVEELQPITHLYIGYGLSWVIMFFAKLHELSTGKSSNPLV